MIPCLLRTPLALVAIGLCMPCTTVRAQSPDPPAAAVPAAPLVDLPAGIDLLEQGDELRITRRDARETFGILQSVSSSSLTIATARFSRVSMARYTSPMPPAPRSSRTS